MEKTSEPEYVTAAKHRGWKHMLVACPMKNQAAKQQRFGDSEALLISVQRKKPRFLIPPFSWMIKINLTRRLQLDSLGLFIWDQCDGTTDVEEIIIRFSQQFRLTFHEARVSVTSYIKDLVQRGALVLVVDNQETAV